MYDKVKRIFIVLIGFLNGEMIYTALIIRIPVPILRQYGLILLAFLFADAFAFEFAS